MKVSDNIVSDDGSLKSDGTQHATVEELSIFQTVNGIYGTARLKPFRCQVADVVIQEIENLKLQR